MEIKVLTNIDDNFRTQWENFVLEHPNGNFFQSPAAYQFFSGVEGYAPVMIYAEEGNNIKGILLAVIIKEPGIKGFFSKRCIVWGGPLSNNTELSNILINELTNYLKNKAIYTEFRPIGRYNIFSAVSVPNMIQEKRLNVLIELTKSTDVLLAELHSTRRRQIQRGYRRGVAVKIIENLDDEIIENCYSILSSVYDKIKLPYPPLSFFNNSIICLKNHLKVFLAKVDDDIIGFRFILCYKDLIYDWYAASKEEHYDKYPNDILPWEVMKWGSENNYKLFDFGGAGKPDEKYGVRDYKLKFGGELITTIRYKIIHNQLLYNIGKLGIKVLGKL